jgi:hypothetical protein
LSKKKKSNKRKKSVDKIKSDEKKIKYEFG